MLFRSPSSYSSYRGRGPSSSSSTRSRRRRLAIPLSVEMDVVRWETADGTPLPSRTRRDDDGEEARDSPQEETIEDARASWSRAFEDAVRRSAIVEREFNKELNAATADHHRGAFGNNVHPIRYANEVVETRSAHFVPIAVEFPVVYSVSREATTSREDEEKDATTTTTSEGKMTDRGDSPTFTIHLAGDPYNWPLGYAERVRDGKLGVAIVRFRPNVKDEELIPVTLGDVHTGRRRRSTTFSTADGSSVELEFGTKGERASVSSATDENVEKNVLDDVVSSLPVTTDSNNNNSSTNRSPKYSMKSSPQGSPRSRASTSAVVATGEELLLDVFPRTTTDTPHHHEPRFKTTTAPPASAATTSSSPGPPRSASPLDSRTFHNSVLGFTLSMFESQGKRKTMEDRILVEMRDFGIFALFDGHGGFACAELARDSILGIFLRHFASTVGCLKRRDDGDGGEKEEVVDVERLKPHLNSFSDPAVLAEVLTQTYSDVEAVILKRMEDERCEAGSTALFCLVTAGAMPPPSSSSSGLLDGNSNGPSPSSISKSNLLLTVANLGDSRAVISRRGTAQILTSDHRPSNWEERERIVKREGGVVDDQGYVGGLIGVSRAFGDLNFENAHDDSVPGFKIKGISAVPDVFSIPLHPPDEEFLIVACDGLWDFMSAEGAVECVRDSLIKSGGELAKAAEDLVSKALSDFRSDDNVSVMIAMFDSYRDALAAEKQRRNGNSLVDPSLASSMSLNVKLMRESSTSSLSSSSSSSVTSVVLDTLLGSNTRSNSISVQVDAPPPPEHPPERTASSASFLSTMMSTSTPTPSTRPRPRFDKSGLAKLAQLLKQE